MHKTKKKKRGAEPFLSQTKRVTLPNCESQELGKEAALVGECVVELAGWRVLSASRKVSGDGCGTKRLLIFITFSLFLSFDF